MAIGGFWSMSAATAIRLVPRIRSRVRWQFSTPVMRWRRSGRTAGKLSGGYGRMARRFLVLVPIAVVAFIWQCISLPSMVRIKATLHVARYSAYLAAAWCGRHDSLLPVFHGAVCTIHLVRPFLESVTRVNSLGLSLIC